MSAALLLATAWTIPAHGQKAPEPLPRKEYPPIAAPGDSIPTSYTEEFTSSRYRITQSDVLELHFPYVPEFTQTVSVQPDGYISLKAVGDVLAMGRTVSELQEVLIERYSEILRQPVLSVILREFEKPYFVVAGEVAHPGKFELRGATTLTQAMALAGGQTPAAKYSEVLLFRRFMNEWLEVKEVDVKKMYATRNMSEDPLLRHGDTILVPKSTMSKISPFIPRPSLGFILNPFGF